MRYCSFPFGACKHLLSESSFGLWMAGLRLKLILFFHWSGLCLLNCLHGIDMDINDINYIKMIKLGKSSNVLLLALRKSMWSVNGRVLPDKTGDWFLWAGAPTWVANCSCKKCWQWSFQDHHRSNWCCFVFFVLFSASVGQLSTSESDPCAVLAAWLPSVWSLSVTRFHLRWGSNIWTLYGGEICEIHKAKYGNLNLISLLSPWHRQGWDREARWHWPYMIEPLRRSLGALGLWHKKAPASETWKIQEKQKSIYIYIYTTNK